MVQPVGSILRPSRVTDLRTGREKRIPWTPHGVSVLFFGHAGCGECEGFTRALGGNVDRFVDWGSSVWSVEVDRSEVPDASAPAGSVGVLLDRQGELRAAAGLGADDAALLVIDVHGQVFYSRSVDGHDFPTIDELALEARFPALQCPECDTPDVPGRAELPG